MLRLLVCVSGGGTNLQAIFDAIDAGKIRNAEIAAVISNNPGAYALERARQHNVEAICLSPKSFESREAFNHALTEKVKEIAPDLIVLAGFLVAVPAEMIEAFPNSTYDRGSISEQNHQYSSIPHSVFLWRRILWSSCP